MDPAVKRIAAVAILTVVISLGMVWYFNNTAQEAEVVSEIDNIGYRVDDTSQDAMNVTLQISVTIENYGKLREEVIPCSDVQSHLELKNSTAPLLNHTGGAFEEGNSYILDDRLFRSTCDGQASTHLVSENVINQLVATVPFRFVSGTYNFIWTHSFADAFLAGQVVIDTAAGTVTTTLEGGSQE